MTHKGVGAQAALEHPYFSSALSAAARMCMSSSEAFATDIGSAESSLSVRELGSGKPESSGNSIRQAQEFDRDRLFCKRFESARGQSIRASQIAGKSRGNGKAPHSSFCKDKRASILQDHPELRCEVGRVVQIPSEALKNMTAEEKSELSGRVENHTVRKRSSANGTRWLKSITTVKAVDRAHGQKEEDIGKGTATKLHLPRFGLVQWSSGG